MYVRTACVGDEGGDASSRCPRPRKWAFITAARSRPSRLMVSSPAEGDWDGGAPQSAIAQAGDRPVKGSS